MNVCAILYIYIYIDICIQLELSSQLIFINKFTLLFTVREHSRYFILVLLYIH